MKVETAREKFLTNFEVYEHLNEVRERAKATHQVAQTQNLDTIAIEIQSYLRERPTANPEFAQSQESITAFLKALHQEGFELEKAERLQLVNSAPSSEPVLYNLIEDCEQRFPEDRVQRLLELVQEHLGYEPMPEMKDE